MELLDTYHADHTPAGHVVRRGEIPQEGELFLVVHILLVNNSGKLLLQKRQDTKNLYPGCWDVSAGGYAQQGEASRPAVLRETQEELGFTPKELQFLFTEPFSHVLDDFYISRCNLPASAFCIQTEEVSEVRWVSEEEALEFWDRGQFVDYHRDLLLRCFAEARRFL